MKTKMTSAAQLCLTALIWGVAFVAQSVGGEQAGPFTFNCVRFFIGGCVLIPVIYCLHKKTSLNKNDIEKKAYRKNTVLGGIFCGILLGVASLFQQTGILYTTAGKAGFITALYIVIVPLLGIFLHKKVSRFLWPAVAAAVVGFYLLGISGKIRLGRGDALLLVCAFLFSLHILVIDYYSPRGDGVSISCIQFFVSALLSGMMMLLFEKPRFGQILGAYVPILYAGVMSCGVAYTLQIVAQKNAEPAVASLILSLESVFSVLAGWVILGEKLSPREFLGCALVFFAVILAQIPPKKSIPSE